jgi:thiosulfate/3-mercaptopyruvate sulfurtransferase
MVAVGLGHLVPVATGPAPPVATMHQRQDPVPMVVSLDWLHANLARPDVVVIMVGNREAYDRGHIPGAARLSHEDTLWSDGHHLAAPATLAHTLAATGATDRTHVVLYGTSAMATGWIYMAFASVGHADRVSMLDGNLAAWRGRGFEVSTASAARTRGTLSVRPAPDLIVDAPWVRERLDNRTTKILDVRTARERAQGYVPGSTLVLWQDLFADQELLTFKPRDDIRALLARTGVTSDQTVVTYCAIGMRASLMYFAARYAGLSARVYLGSWEDWRNQPGYPIAR